MTGRGALTCAYRGWCSPAIQTRALRPDPLGRGDDGDDATRERLAWVGKLVVGGAMCQRVRFGVGAP